MRRKRNLPGATPLAWWMRCAVVALACLQVVAPTWHICSMGATGAAPGQKMAMVHCTCGMPSMQQSAKPGQSQLTNQPMAMDFCLAQLLQDMLGNNQFHFSPDFTSITISILREHAAALPLTCTLPVKAARGPPLHLL